MTAASQAFLQTCQPQLPRLYRLGLRLSRDPAEAEDLVQETLTRAWTHWDRFEEGGRIGAWLSRILTNAFISRHRHKKVVRRTHERPDLENHLVSPDRLRAQRSPETDLHRALGASMGDEVQEALGALPPNYVAVVQCIDVQGLSYKDTAEVLGIPVGTVMSRLHRARRRLRGDLEEYARGYGLAA